MRGTVAVISCAALMVRAPVLARTRQPIALVRLLSSLARASGHQRQRSYPHFDLTGSKHAAQSIRVTTIIPALISARNSDLRIDHFIAAESIKLSRADTAGRDFFVKKEKPLFERLNAAMLLGFLPEMPKPQPDFVEAVVSS